MDLTLFDKYRAEISEELDLSDFNIKEVQLKLPSIKHKWVSRIIAQKIELSKTKKLKTEAIEAITNTLRRDNPVLLTDATLARQAEKNETVQKILVKIEELETIIEYLEKIEKVCMSTTYDIKNLVELKKLEIQ
jgi:hypothetical protein